MNNSLKRAAAGIMALSMVTGSVPFQPVTKALTSLTAITANAEEDGTEITQTVNPVVSYVPGDHCVTLSWDAVEGAEEYLIAAKVGGSWAKVAVCNDTWYLLEKLVAGENYEVAVAAKINGRWSTRGVKPITVTPNKIIAPNMSTEYYPMSGKLNVNWVAVPGADEYAICLKFTGGEWQLYRKLSGDTTAFKCRVDTSASRRFKFVVIAKVNGKWETANMDKRAVTVDTNSGLPW